MRFEVAGDRRGVLDMTLHAQRQRLKSLQEQERVERAHAGTEIAQRLGTQFHQVAVCAEGFVKLQAVIRGRGLGDHREAPVRPIELPGIHDYTANARAVAANVFGRRVQHNVRPPLDRTAQIRRSKGVVDQQGKSVLMRDGCNRLNVEHIAARIAHGLREKRLGVVAYRGSPGGEVVGIDPGQLHARLT